MQINQGHIVKKIYFALPIILLLHLFSCSDVGALQNNGNDSFEWPRFLGPNANGTSDETGLLRSWPETGPEEIWRIPLGTGYAGMSVSNSRLYTMDSDETTEYVVCLDAETGETLWRREIGPRFKNSYGDGPRVTPTIDGERIYAIGAEGNLIAAQAQTGEIVWQMDIKSRFTFRPPEYWWGYTGSPVIENDLLIVQAAGEGEKTLAGLKKETGEVVWTCHNDLAAYSTPTAIDFAGKRQFIFVTGKSVVSVAPETGDIFWRYPWGGHFIKVTTPVFVPPDRIFVSASYGIGAVLLQMQAAGESLTVREVWKSNIMENHFQTPILLGDFLYGFDNGTFKCIEAASGTQMWVKRRLGKGSLIYADSMLIVLSDRGQLVLAEANPNAYVELASAQVLSGRCWTPPTLANGKLYLRNQSEMVCLKMK